MTAEITGSNPVAQFEDDTPPAPRRHLHAVDANDQLEIERASWRVRFVDMAFRRNPWLPDILNRNRAEAYQQGVHDTLSRLSEDQHILAHPDLPIGFHEALQRGPLGDPLGDTTIHIDGIPVIVTLTSHGTGHPRPDSVNAWKALRETVRTVTAAPYCPHTLCPLLPREIAGATWVDRDGRVVTVHPPTLAPPAP